MLRADEKANPICQETQYRWNLFFLCSEEKHLFRFFFIALSFIAYHNQCMIYSFSLFFFSINMKEEKTNFYLFQAFCSLYFDGLFFGVCVDGSWNLSSLVAWKWRRKEILMHAILNQDSQHFQKLFVLTHLHLTLTHT